MSRQASPDANWCADCSFARMDGTMEPREKRMVYKMCKTPGCPSWNKKNEKRNRPSVLQKKSYA